VSYSPRYKVLPATRANLGTTSLAEITLEGMLLNIMALPRDTPSYIKLRTPHSLVHAGA